VRFGARTLGDCHREGSSGKKMSIFFLLCDKNAHFFIPLGTQSASHCGRCVLVVAASQAPFQHGDERCAHWLLAPRPRQCQDVRGWPRRHGCHSRRHCRVSLKNVHKRFAIMIFLTFFSPQVGVARVRCQRGRPACAAVGALHSSGRILRNAIRLASHRGIDARCRSG